MPSDHNPMTDKELEHFETTRDLGADLLESIRQMKAGMGAVVYSPFIAARQKGKLTQSQFATFLGVSPRTLQEWVQGRRSPSGVAKTLLRVAEAHPEVLRELAV